MQATRFTLLLVVLLTFGCGKKVVSNSFQTARFDPIGSGPSVESQDETPTLPTQAQVEAAKKGTLACDFSEECEPALAMVSIALGNGLRRCSGFLISDHEVLTNDHCLAAIPVNACNGLVYTHFTENVHRGCKNISIRSFQIGINSKDYAVIELDAPIKDRKPLHASRRGFNDQESASVFSVQTGFSSGTKTYDGHQLKRSCQASYSTLMNINILSSRESLMTFGDCAVQAGNSGSPVFNADGDVGAVIQGYLTVRGEEFPEILKPYLLDGNYGQVAVGTQTRCISELVGNPAKPCEAVKPVTALYPEQYLQGFGAFSNRYLPVLSPTLVWRAIGVAKKDEKKMISVPQCVSPIETSRKSSFTTDVLTLKQGINSKLQAEWRSMNPAQTLFVADPRTSESVKIVIFSSAEYGKITLPVCQ